MPVPTDAVRPASRPGSVKRPGRSQRRAVSSTAPTISVVIVNYCQWRNTLALTRQLRRSDALRAGDAEIIIVDNASFHHPAAARLRRTNGVSLRRFSQNRGFGPAVNEGVRRGRGDWIVLLNPDVSVPAGFLDDVDRYVANLERSAPDVGVVGFEVADSDGSLQPSCGPLPTLERTLAGIVKPRSCRKCQVHRTKVPVEVDWATGCALLIRRDCFQQIGGFDPAFFLYYEDVDFCRRAAKEGWKVCFDPNLRVRHHTPFHSRSTPPRLRLMTRHALVTYSLKHWPRWQSAVLGAIIGMETMVRQAAAWCRGEKSEALLHRETRRVVTEMLSGRWTLARRRIDSAAQGLGSTAAAQDGRRC